MFKGSIVAIVTPFKKGKVDEKALGDLIEWQIAEGTSAIVPCGTTGESATLDYKEHYKVIALTVKTVNKRVPVIAGTGANSTDETIEITKHAKKSGADGALLVAPYYNKPTQEGLYRHYRTVAEKVDIPIVLYNVPGRTAVNILPATVARLAEIKNIVAIKEATGDMKQVSEVLRLHDSSPSCPGRKGRHIRYGERSSQSRLPDVFLVDEGTAGQGKSAALQARTFECGDVYRD
jgi:4-hydroxy-tetrahydrodipicolinate synthase